MFVLHDTLLFILSGDLKDAVWQERTFHLLFPAGDPSRHWPQVLDWLKLLPDAEKARKIIDSESHRHVNDAGMEEIVRGGFRTIAREERADLKDLRWWDIDLKKRHLMGQVTRPDGIVTPILLMWKKRPVKNTEERMHAPPGHAAWEWNPDMNEPKNSRWRFVIEGETIDNVKNSFITWLNKSVDQLHLPDTFLERNTEAAA